MSDEVRGRLNTSAWRAVDQAKNEARRLGHTNVRAEHILLALLRAEESVAVRTLRRLGVELGALRQQVENIVGRGDRAPSGTISFTPQAEKALELARREALRLRHENIGSEHLLLGLMSGGVGGVAQVLAGMGADQDRVRHEAVQLREQAEPSRAAKVPSTGATLSVLEYFGQNLTRRASEGSLGPVIARDREIDQVMAVLAQPTANNPVLIGGSSAARTAVIAGLAQAIAKGGGQGITKDKQLYSFSPVEFAKSGRASSLQDPQLRTRVLELLGRLDPSARPEDQGAAGKVSDERSSRDPHRTLSNLDVVAAILEECRSRHEIILIIDELPKVAGAAVADGEIDIMPILKPLLTSGRLQIIGAGAADEYGQSLAGDNELSPWLQPVQVTEHRTTYTIGMLEVALRAATRVRSPTCRLPPPII
jgi:ATP-dependent Clp protease ATP-binding subunit ClpC